MRGVENLSMRDLRVLARVARRGRVHARELADLGSTGGVYASLNRLAALGYIRKVGRGVYEATEQGIQFLRSIEKEIEVEG